MPKQKQRSVFWVVSTHVLTTGFAMPFVAGLVAIAVIAAIQPSPLMSFLILMAIQAVGYIGGVFYSLSYIRKVAQIQNPQACIKPSNITFLILALLGLAANLLAQFGSDESNINPIVVVIALVAFYGIIFIAFAKITRDEFSRMASAGSDD